MAADVSFSESLAIGDFASVIGADRDQLLVYYHQMKSFFAQNRSPYEIARAKVLEGTPPTTKEALSNLAVVIAGVVGIEGIAFGGAALGTGAAVFLGFSTAGAAPALLGIGLVIICVVLVIELTLTVASFCKGLYDGAMQKATDALQ